MTESKPAKRPRTVSERFVRIIAWTFVVLVAVEVLALPVIGLLLQLGGLLLFGWFDYLVQVLPRVRFNTEIALDAVIALALAIFGLHQILRWWKKKQHGDAAVWRFGWTTKITAMALLLFATSIAATGIAHQIGWLFRAESLVRDASRGTQIRELSNIKQVAVGLRLFADDHDGNLPRELNELVPDYLPDHSLFFSTAIPNEPPEQILYFPDNQATNPDEIIVVAGPQPTKSGKRAVARRDASASTVSESEFQELMLKQRPANRTTVPLPESAPEHDDIF
jgi:hypothetical protein